MGRLGRASWLVFACAGAAAACSLVTSFDGYVGGPAPPRDASDDGADVAVVSDAATADAGPLDAGPLDAGPLPDGYCTDAALCDDFERSDLDGPWNKSVVSLADVTIGTARAHSYGRSLHAEVSPYTGGASALSKVFLSVSTLHAKFFLFMTNDSRTRAYEMTELRFTYASHIASVGTLVNVEKMVFGEQTYPTDGGTTLVQNSLVVRDLIVDRWFELDFVVDVAATPATASITVDGVNVANKVPLAFEYGRTKGEVFAGITYTQGGSPATAVDIDDVRLDVVP